jgi:two-component system, LytTR family, response regulator LytT
MSNKEIRYLIVDDDLVSATLLRKYLKSYEHLKFEGLVENTERASDFLASNKVDLLFLDIEMPGVDGLSFMRTLEIEIMVIFVTSKPKYALPAFDFDPVHFLTKPLDRDKLSEAIRRVNIRLKKNVNTVETSGPSYLIIKDKGALVKIPFDEISYVEASADYMVIYTENKSFIHHITMKELILQLPEPLFKRIHRSYVINVSQVSRVEKDQLVLGDKVIRIGPKYKESIKSIFLN